MSVIGAVDIGGTKIAVGLVNPEGAILEAVRWQSDPEQSPHVVIDRIADTLRSLCVKQQEVLTGIGAAVTGPVDFNRGILGENAFLPAWSGLPFATLLLHRLEVPVFVDNDAMASALGEFLWGAGKGARDFIYLTISTGIGVGVILKGEVFRGAKGAHGESGHQVIDYNAEGTPCYCGARGCWESLASGKAMAKLWAESHPGSHWDARQICAAAREDNAEALKAVAQEGRYLGIGIANLITHFVPDCVCLGGGVMESFDLFEPYIQRQVQNQCGLVPWQNTSIVKAHFAGSAGLVGAAAIFPAQHYGIQGLH